MFGLNFSSCLAGLICLTLTLFLQKSCPAQSVDEWAGRKLEDSFTTLTDKRLRREIAMFATAPSFEKEFEKAPKLELKEIPLKSCADNSVEFQGDGVNVMIEKMAFDTTSHQLGYTDHFLNLIDGKVFWGTDGGVPREKLKSVVVMFGNNRLSLSKTAIEALYEPNLCYRIHNGRKFDSRPPKVFRSLDKKTVYIFMMNSDGAGGYEVTWIFQNGKYLRRVVDYGF
jgi:hypothetical protein